MITWIRIARDIPTDPKVGKLAGLLSSDINYAIGLLVRLYSNVAEHCPTGHVGDVPDSMLELWVGWRGRRGRFATAYRAIFAPDGNIHAWDKHNGVAIREAKASADRAREWRNERRTERHTSPVRNGATNGVTNAPRTVLRDVTRRDELQVLTTSSKATDTAAVASAPESSSAEPSPDTDPVANGKKPRAPRRQHTDRRGPVQFPFFPAVDCSELHAAWTAHVGAVDYARLRKALGPLYAKPDPGFTLPHALLAIEWYAACENTAQGRNFRSPERLAANWPHWLHVASLPPDQRAAHLPPPDRTR